MTRANNISEVTSGFAVDRIKKWGDLYLGDGVDGQTDKKIKIYRNKADESSAIVPLERDTDVPTNGTTHVG